MNVVFVFYFALLRSAVERQHDMQKRGNTAGWRVLFFEKACLQGWHWAGIWELAGHLPTHSYNTFPK